jgi:hypothetical protein
MARKLLEGAFMAKNNTEALTRALSTLREVTQKLALGVNKTQLEQDYRGRYVSPGISVRRYIEELRLSGSLDETNTTIKLRQKHSSVAA